MSNFGIVKSYTVDTAANVTIPPYRIVKPGATDGTVTYGTSATDPLTGVTADIPADPGQRVDVAHSGLPEIEFGGTVAAGAPITSDNIGRAVAAAPAAGSNVRIIGFALTACVLGDIQPAMLFPSVMQG